MAKSSPATGPFGEAWDISAILPHISTVSGGQFAGLTLTELWTSHSEDLVGYSDNRSHSVFPLLVKWLECRGLLSLQVHPDDKFARTVLEQPYGKSEAWVVLDAEPGARIFAGLKQGVTRSDFERHLHLGTVEECVHSFAPKAGDCIALPAGTVHAAGGGVLIAEVQQSSDTTFRLFDWNQPGLDGRPRPLQTELGLQAIDWQQGPIAPVLPRQLQRLGEAMKGEQLCEMAAFSLERYAIKQESKVPHAGALSLWMILAGKVELRSEYSAYRRILNKGDTVLIPASSAEMTFAPIDANNPAVALCVRCRD